MPPIKFDPLDCERPACDDMTSKMKAAQAAMKRKAAATAAAVDCPASSVELGRASWTLLHSMVAWYPDKPNEKEQSHIRNFFSALALFYPCSYCAQDFQEQIKEKPVVTDTRQGLCQWLCEQHNQVNEKLGKPLFPCDIKSLDERWRKSTSESCRISET